MINMNIENLKQLGLTKYESKSYVALLELGPSSGREVAKKSGVPPTRVFDALESLEEKGFVSLIEEKPMVFKAIEPKNAITLFTRKKIDALEGIKNEVIRDLGGIKRTPIPKIKEKFMVVSGFEKMYIHAANLIDLAEKEVLIYSSAEGSPDFVIRTIKNAIKKGVKIRFITSRYIKKNKKFVKRLKDTGLKIKYHKSEDYSLSIIDRKIVIIVIKDPKEPKNRISTFFVDTGLAKALSSWFNQTWKKAKPIKL